MFVHYLNLTKILFLETAITVMLDQIGIKSIHVKDLFLFIVFIHHLIIQVNFMYFFFIFTLTAVEIDSHAVCIIANNDNVFDTTSGSGDSDSVQSSINLLQLTNFPAIRSDCHIDDNNNNDNTFFINQVQQGVSNGCAVSLNFF